MDIDRKDYKGTPIGYPMGNSIKKEDELYGKKYPNAYPHYDENNLYLPLGIYSGNNAKGNMTYYMEINKHCIMDALEYWKSIKEPEDDDIQYFRHTTIIEAANIGFDNMIVKGVLALNNREYKEEKEISDDE